VLALDDNPAILRLLRRALSAAGFAVTVVSTGEAAHQALQVGKFDLVVTDLHIDGPESGLALARAASQCTPAVPVVVITGSHSMSTGELTDWSHVSEVLLKPFAPSKLVSVCQFAIEAQRSRSDG